MACIHKQLLEDGIEAYVAYGRGEKTLDKNVFMFGDKLGVYTSAALSRFIGLNGWFNHRATRKLIRFIKNIKPDLIHLHVLHGYYLNVPMLFRYINKCRIPCVWTFHDCHAFVGNCGYPFLCQKWQTGCGKCSSLKKYPVSQWFDWTGWMWKRKKELFTDGEKKIIVTPSDWLTGEARKSFFRKYECMTIHNGIDTKDIFYPRDREKCRKKYGFSAEEKLVLGIAVGYRDERKGAKYILQMARELQQDAKVILIGWNRENDDWLEGLSNVITLPNTQDAEMLAEYYSMVDVFVIPSLAENYATTTLETMACGTPVVGFTAGGIPEQLENRKGIAVETGNQEAFTQAVRKVLTEPNCVVRGTRLAELIQEENSMAKMTGEYREVYEKLLEEI